MSFPETVFSSFEASPVKLEGTIATLAWLDAYVESVLIFIQKYEFRKGGRHRQKPFHDKFSAFLFKPRHSQRPKLNGTQRSRARWSLQSVASMYIKKGLLVHKNHWWAIEEEEMFSLGRFIAVPCLGFSEFFTSAITPAWTGLLLKVIEASWN